MSGNTKLAMFAGMSAVMVVAVGSVQVGGPSLFGTVALVAGGAAVY